MYTDAKPEPPNVLQTISDWTFNSFIVTRALIHTMAGNWVITSWSQGLLSYQKGTMSLERKVSTKELASGYLGTKPGEFKFSRP